jgi:RNA polymerase sigma-B factor
MLDSSFVPPTSPGNLDVRAFKALAAAPHDERADLEHELVLKHMAFAEGVARRFSSPTGDSSDIRQVALLGLVKSVKRFDPDRAVPFTAFARATIVGEIKRYLRDHAWAVRPPRSVQELALAVTAATPALEQSLQRRPSRAELAEHLATDVAKIAAAAKGGSAMFATSLDDITVSSTARAAAVPDPAEGIEWRADLRDAMRSLSPREQEIIYLRYYKGCTQQEIAETIGTSQVQVSRTLANLLARIREHMGDAYSL